MLQHKYGIYSIELKNKFSKIEMFEEKPLPLATSDPFDHVDLLLTRVKGISQRVDTMHLNDQDTLDAACEQTDEELSEQQLELQELHYHSTDEANCNGSDNDTDTASAAADHPLASTYTISTRRRKSPSNANKPTVIANSLRRLVNPGGGNNRSNSNTSAMSNSLDPPGSSCTEKKLRKPSSNVIEAARHTIASSVRMTQTALEKKQTQTQGDKLNQIKALRRHHSRIVNSNRWAFNIFDSYNSCTQHKYPVIFASAASLIRISDIRVPAPSHFATTTMWLMCPRRHWALKPAVVCQPMHQQQQQQRR